VEGRPLSGARGNWVARPPTAAADAAAARHRQKCLCHIVKALRRFVVMTYSLARDESTSCHCSLMAGRPTSVPAASARG
jgi:hypothetical protein